MHKFHLGQTVTYNPRKGTWAPRGAYIVTAKFPEWEGEFEYRIRSAIEDNERMARESELEFMRDTEAPPARESNDPTPETRVAKREAVSCG
jgi:hypothetical protein